MRLALMLTLAAMTAGCSTAAWNEMRANPREYFNLIPPTLETDARVDGQRVTLTRGQALVVRIDEDQAYGQRWHMQPIPSTIAIAPVRHDFNAKAGAQAPTPDSPGVAVFRVRGVAPGTQPVVLEFRRPSEPPSKTIRFEVVVR